MKPTNMMRIAALLGALAVVLGAFGAHALKETLTLNQRLDTYELAVRYHFYHVFALALTALLSQAGDTRRLQAAAWAFLAGIMLFSGSLYVLSLTGAAFMAWLTPLGGGSFIAGWLLLFSALTKKAAGPNRQQIP